MWTRWKQEYIENGRLCGLCYVNKIWRKCGLTLRPAVSGGPAERPQQCLEVPRSGLSSVWRSRGAASAVSGGPGERPNFTFQISAHIRCTVSEHLETNKKQCVLNYNNVNSHIRGILCRLKNQGQRHRYLRTIWKLYQWIGFGLGTRPCQIRVRLLEIFVFH
jgi:hypothetical protein